MDYIATINKQNQTIDELEMELIDERHKNEDIEGQFDDLLIENKQLRDEIADYVEVIEALQRKNRNLEHAAQLQRNRIDL